MKYSKVRDVKSPERGTKLSAGTDFFVPNDFKETMVNPGRDLLIPSGIVAKLPKGYMLMAADKSGAVTSKQACLNANRTPKKEAFDSVIIIGAKIVDEDFQGEIHIHLINVGCESVVIKPGMKITQFILVPVSYESFEEVPRDELFSDVSERGAGCFGSTDKKLLVYDMDSGVYFDRRGAVIDKAAIKLDFVQSFESKDEAIAFCARRAALRLEPILV